VPEVEAPEGSGFDTGAFGSGACLGLVLEVEGVGDKQGLLVVGELLELGLGVVTGGGTGAGGAAEGAALG
jgi:hypothetical protein